MFLRFVQTLLYHNYHLNHNENYFLDDCEQFDRYGQFDDQKLKTKPY